MVAPACSVAYMRDQGTRRATQADLEAAARKYSTAAGEKQAALAAPLTEAELATGDGYGVGITDVDCTPRPRYGESRERFEARMRSYGVELEVLKTDVRIRNRRAALREGAWPDGAPYYFTQCACGWCGLRVTDPEVARREYDAHACVAESVGQSAVDRAIAETDRMVLVKRPRAVLQPAVMSSQEADRSPVRVEVATDDTEQRMALLELDKP